MFEYIREKISEYVDDFAYKAKHSVKHVLAKAGIKGATKQVIGVAVDGAFTGAIKKGEEVAIKSALKNAAKHIATEDIPVVGNLMAKVFGPHLSKVDATFLIAAPITSAFSLWMEQEEYHHNLDKILNHYRPEIASWLNNGKRPEQLTHDDLYDAAYGDPTRNIPGNPTLQDALKQTVLERNWSMGISVAATATSTYASALAEETVDEHIRRGLAGMFGEGTALATSSWLNNGLEMLALGVLSYAVYVAVKTPLHWLAEQCFGVEKETVAEKIDGLRRGREEGRAVTEAQVMEIYLAAHPNLDNDIRENYGKHFSRMRPKAKEAVLAEFGPKLDLERIATEINEGRMRPEELAFAISEQNSGVSKGEGSPMPSPEKLLKRAWYKCKDSICTVFKRKASEVKSKPASLVTEPQVVTIAAATPDGKEEMAMQFYEDAKPGQHMSYVQMVGTQRGKDGNLSYREFVEQSRAGAELGAVLS